MAASGADPTHYDRLGVGMAADDDAIQRAYRDRVRELHPDLHPEWTDAEREAAEAELIEVVLANKVLRDPRRRRVYDGAIGAMPDSDEVASRDGDTGADEADFLQEFRGFRAYGVRLSDLWDAKRAPPEHEPPPGFRLYGSFSRPPYLRAPSYYRTKWDVFADALNAGVSLQALQPDLSPLRAYARDGLWRLRAERIPVSDDDLEHLSGIESLREVILAYTQVTDRGLRHLVALPRLRVLDLWGTAVTDDGLRTLGRAAGTLDRLNVGKTKITDAGLVHLRYMHTLDELNLRATAVRGPGLAHLHGLVTLDRVSLPARVSRSARRDLARALPRLEIL